MIYLRLLVLSGLCLMVACSVGEDIDPSKFIQMNAPVYNGRYIVELKHSLERAEVFSEYEAHDNTKTKQKVHVVDMDEQDAIALSNDHRVLRVEEDALLVRQGAMQTLPLLFSQNNAPWHLDRIDERALVLNGSYQTQYTGSGVTVYVIDDGIRTSHTEFGGRASFGTNTASGIDQACSFHGTSVAGFIGSTTYGAAKDIRLVDVNTHDCNVGGRVSDLVQAIQWVQNNAQGSSIANISQGIEGLSTIQSVNTAIDELTDAGILTVVAAGNEGVDACTRTLASSDSALTVGAVDVDNNAYDGDGASYGNFGSCIDIWAPGINVTSAGNANDYATITGLGSSFAAPLVAGAAAMILEENPGFSPSQIKQEIYNMSLQNVLGNVGANPRDRMLSVTKEAPLEDVTTPIVPNTVFCQSSESDSDGDGWGWENGASCKVVLGDATTQPDVPQSVPGVVYCQSSESDSDGDGWGWENGESCRMQR